MSVSRVISLFRTHHLNSGTWFLAKGCEMLIVCDVRTLQLKATFMKPTELYMYGN